MNYIELKAIEESIIRDIHKTINELVAEEHPETFTTDKITNIHIFITNIIHATNKQLKEKHINLHISEHLEMR